MKTSLVVAAAILIVFAAAFALVRLDLVAADALRLMPAIAAAIIAVGIVYEAVRRKVEKKKGKK